MTDPNRRRLLATSASALTAAGLVTNVSAQSLAAAPDNWMTASQGERDGAYNNSTAVPGSAGIVEGWTTDSARFRAQHAGTIDLAYGPRPRNKWDLFPAPDRMAPCLVHVHGGYWQARSRENFSCMMEGVLAAGFAAAMPGYTLAPDATLLEIVAEVHRALDWLGAEGPAHGIAGPIILSGWSAGGHLCAVGLRHPSVRAGLAMSGIYELGPLRDTYLNAKLHLSDGEIATLSPLRLPSVDKPLVLAYGTAELPALVENSRSFHAYRSARHQAGALIPVPRANHFTIYDHLRPADGLLTRAVLELGRTLRA